MTEISGDEEFGADDALLARLVDDLDAGFVDLVQSYEQVVYSVALRVSGAAADAEDLAAETFLRAYRGLREYDGMRILALQPRQWLLTIVLNTWRNSLRDSSRRPSQVPLSELDDRPVGGPGVEEQAEQNENLRELTGLLRELPPAQRACVVLRHVVGLPIAEVAVIAGCPEGTAKSHVSRGLRRLRALYLERGGLAPAAVPIPDTVPALATRREQR